MFLLVGFEPVLVLDSRADDSLGASATIDHTDIRGSEPHGHDPSGAASDEWRGLGPETVPHNSRRGFSFSWALGYHQRCCPVIRHGLSCLSWLSWFAVRFGIHGDRPQEAEQLTG